MSAHDDNSSMWPPPPDAWRDTSARRVAVRLSYLGWTQADLGAAMGVIEGRDGPIEGGSIRPYLAGRRPFERIARRVAAAMGVPPASLLPGGDWRPLVSSAGRTFPRRDPVTEARAKA